MEVYLVRHGRTDGNVAHRHQHPETKLNERGTAQAKAAAEIIATKNPTHLIVSTNLRAVQSGAFIADATGLVPETYSPFEELHQPKSLIGERLTGLRAIGYMVKWFLGFKSASMHDGESYADFVSRLKRARHHLEKLPEDSVVVIVSHSVFINFFTEHMIRPKRMGPIRAAVLFFKILKMRNSSITHARYQKPQNTKNTGWKLLRV
ncbi:histidine phosphatase family protein [Patescibacteria group bacterium]|nr:histidine phosphatase family protein [Patescibacteria group bacterium]